MSISFFKAAVKQLFTTDLKKTLDQALSGMIYLESGREFIEKNTKSRCTGI
jgi:hypothetical protein